MMFGFLKIWAKREKSSEFDQLFSKHYPMVYQLALRLSGDQSEAQDIAQETFVAVHKGLGSFKGESEFTTWIYRITIRIAGRHLSRIGPTEAIQEHEVVDAQSQCANGVTQEQINQAMNRLSLTNRTILSLIALEGLTHRQVAEILQVPEGTIGSRLFNARQKLAQHLKIQGVI